MQAGNLYMFVMHNPVFFNDPSGRVAVPALAGTVVLYVGGVMVVVTGAYLLTPSVQQLLSDATWAFVDGVELVGAALGNFVDATGNLAIQAGTGLAGGLVSNIRGRVTGNSRSGTSTGGTSSANPGPNDPWGGRNWQRVEDRRLKRALQQEHGISPHELKHEYLGQRAQIRFYDIFIDKNSGQLAIFEKSSGRIVVITDYIIP